MITVQLGNISLGLVLVLLVLKFAFWTSMPWAVVLAPFWIPFCFWGIMFGFTMIWILVMLVVQLLSHLLSTIRR